MSEHQSTLNAGQIQFHQWCEPPLEPGDYTVRVDQTVQELAEVGSYSNAYRFSAAGPRFALNPSEVYSVYPPKGHIGDFANSLPHVVFTRRTLPWERSLTPPHRLPGDKMPWMALLVFSADDFSDGAFPDVELRPVGELINPDANDDFVGPQIDELAAYESEKDLCSTIDLPWDLFQSVAPSMADLGYLAHVREVNTGNKETLSFLADGWFAVVLANRFPQPERPLSAASFRDVPSIINRLRSGVDPVSQELWQRFSKSSRDKASDPQAQLSVLIEEFNRIVRGNSLYEPERFAMVKLSAETQELLNRSLRDPLHDPLQGSELVQFNRLILEDTYPGAMVKSTPLAVENRAVLVSLEGMMEYLPGKKSAANKPVRLAVLSSWSFHCREAFAFKAAMDKIGVRRLCVPWNNKSAANGRFSEAAQQVLGAYKRGYTALNHSTRLGEKTVSWYRGPLVPLYLTKETKYRFQPAADAALRYNPLDGMLDVTYAAAFQLGRLLALQDRHFATALYAYRNGVRRQINQILGRKRVQSVLGSSENVEENELMNAYLKTLKEDSGSSTPKAGWAAEKFDIGLLEGDDNSDAMKNPNALHLTTDFNLTIPKSICRWLARLMLLYRVPFVNLVPDERMLPPDSMRFFYLDPGWLKCLLEGACSVGRSSSQDELVDEHLRDNFLKLAIDESPKVRTRIPERGAAAAKPIEVSAIAATGLDWPQLTGFLIRSPVVAGWQGLEMQAWADSGKHATYALAPWRIDRLAPDIMLCIFNGKVNRIEVKQPPEGMHFGSSVVGDGFKRFFLRRLNETGPELGANDQRDGIDPGPGHQLDDTSATPIPLRKQAVKRVVDVSQLADDFKEKLKAMQARDDTKEFTSADFGVEMVESPGRVLFDVENQQDSDAS